MSEEVSGFQRSSYSLLKRQEAGFTKTGSRTLQISIIVFFSSSYFFRLGRKQYLFQKLIGDGNTSKHIIFI